MLKYSSLSTVGSLSEQFGIMFSFFCQLPDQETCFHQRQRAFRQFSRFECNLGQICPWMGVQAIFFVLLTSLTVFTRLTFVSETIIFCTENICEDLWKDFDSRQIKAGDFFKKSAPCRSVLHLSFLLPTFNQSQSDGAHPAWPGFGHTWAPIPDHLSFVWNIWESGILPLTSVVICTRSQCSQGEEIPRHKSAYIQHSRNIWAFILPCILKKKWNFWLSISFYFFAHVPLPQAATSLSLHDQSNCMHLY